VGFVVETCTDVMFTVASAYPKKQNEITKNKNARDKFDIDLSATDFRMKPLSILDKRRLSKLTNIANHTFIPNATIPRSGFNDDCLPNVF